MLNIDTRILRELDESEYWLLSHLAKRINLKSGGKICWPSNKTLCKDCGWHIEKLQRVKGTLVTKGFIEVIPQINSSNVYKINTQKIGVYISLDEIEFSDCEIRGTGKSDMGGTGKSDMGGTGKSDNEVLTNEVLGILPDESGKQPIGLFVESQPSGNSRKLANEQYPEFKQFIDLWCIKYPSMLTMPKDGAKVKSIIRQVRELVKSKQLDTSAENVVEFWRIFVDNLHRTWGHGKDLSTIDSKLKSLVFELENPKAKKGTVSSWESELGEFANY